MISSYEAANELLVFGVRKTTVWKKLCNNNQSSKISKRSFGFIRVLAEKLMEVIITYFKKKIDAPKYTPEQIQRPLESAKT